MYWVAFTLGFLGSLHCAGMCGALSCAMCTNQRGSKFGLFYSTVSYHSGRILTYAIYGVLFGLLSEVVILGNIQSIVSIILGLLFMIVVLIQVDLEYRLQSLPKIQAFYLRVKSMLGNAYRDSKRFPRFVLGMINGLLPCGLVYLALAGSLTTSSFWQSIMFMTMFGVGTLPMMFGITLGVSRIPFKLKSSFRKTIPYATFAFGVYLVFRGVAISIPAELDFWHALKHPVMCFGSE